MPFGKHSIPLQVSLEVVEVQTSKPSSMYLMACTLLLSLFLQGVTLIGPSQKKIMPKIESLYIMILLKAILNPKYSIQVILQLPVSGFFLRNFCL